MTNVMQFVLRKHISLKRTIYTITSFYFRFSEAVEDEPNERGKVSVKQMQLYSLLSNATFVARDY